MPRSPEREEKSRFSLAGSAKKNRREGTTMKIHLRLTFRLGLGAFAVAAATLIAGESRADFDLGQGIVLAPAAQIPVPPGVTSDPLSATVYCNAGGKVATALALKPLTTSRLTITISGTCTESVDNVPGGVTLQAAASGDGLKAPSSSTDPVLGISGTGVTLDGLTISGGVNALRGRSGAAFTGNNLVIQGASNANVYMSHAVATLNTSTIQNSANDGIWGYWGSTVHLNGGVVQGNARYGAEFGPAASFDVFGGAVLQNNGLGGAEASGGGVLDVTGGTVQNNAGDGLTAGSGGQLRVNGSSTSVVSNGGNGISVLEGGALFLGTGAVVANNSANGINIYGGGAAKVTSGAVVQGNTFNGIYVESSTVVEGDANGPATIQNNKQNGIFMRTNSVATFGNSGNKIINNTGWGILCTGSPSNPLIYGTVGTVSGNESGQIACNTSPNAAAAGQRWLTAPLIPPAESADR
jgi:hypothetical protein